MKSTNTNETAQIRGSQIQTSTSAQAGTEVSRGAMIATGTLGALFGTWSVACFVGGLLAAGGPLSFVRSWFTAVSGM